MSRFALVTGATGVVGPSLVEELVARGYRVRVIVRHTPSPGLIESNVDICVCDITDPVAVKAAMEGVDTVFHLAAKLHINSPDPQLRGEYRRINVDGTRVVADAATAANVSRLVLFSTIAVYGFTQPGEILDETAPARSVSLYGATKRDAELITLNARRAADGAPIGVVLRIAGIYGPRIKGNYRQLVRWIRRGWFVPIGAGHNRRTLVHYRDVTAAAILAAEHPAAVGEIFNVTDGSIHTFRDIVGEIAGALGRRAPAVHLPEAPIRIAARLLDRVRRLFARQVFAEAMLNKMLEDMAVSGTRIQSMLGFRPTFDLHSGWAETVPELLREEQRITRS